MAAVRDGVGEGVGERVGRASEGREDSLRDVYV
jgi:hypothetical protein